MPNKPKTPAALKKDLEGQAFALVLSKKGTDHEPTVEELDKAKKKLVKQEVKRLRAQQLQDERNKLNPLPQSYQSWPMDQDMRPMLCVQLPTGNTIMQYCENPEQQREAERQRRHHLHLQKSYGYVLSPEDEEILARYAYTSAYHPVLMPQLLVEASLVSPDKNYWAQRQNITRKQMYYWSKDPDKPEYQAAYQKACDNGSLLVTNELWRRFSAGELSEQSLFRMLKHFEHEDWLDPREQTTQNQSSGTWQIAHNPNVFHGKPFVPEAANQPQMSKDAFFAHLEQINQQNLQPGTMQPTNNLNPNSIMQGAANG